VTRSAGLLLYRRVGSNPEVFLVHPGGPYWTKKDEGAWSIPKGLIDDDESPLAAAKREFGEETGFLPHGTFIELGSFKQPSSKVIFAWAVDGEFVPATSNAPLFPWSGRRSRAAFGSFRRWIGRHGSNLAKPFGRSQRDGGPLSKNCFVVWVLIGNRLSIRPESMRFASIRGLDSDQSRRAAQHLA
jgi:predicted NUDIX family NTP pyrophosphohydrolase